MATANNVGMQPRGRYFYFLIAILVALLVFIGFARTFFLNSIFAKRDLSALYVVHGIVFTSWILLFITQTWLVASDRIAVHRRLGVAGVVLAAAMIVVGMAIALHAARYGFQTPGLPPPLVFFAVPFFDILVFAVLVGFALYYRHTPDTHKRLMLVAAISMLPPAIARIPLHFLAATLPVSAFVIADLILIGCIAYDVALGRRLHRAFVWGGLLFILSFPLRMILAGTAAWISFARWISGA
ncbi:MAG: hypothetical protein NVS9B14_15580 [Candidatus Acidiferrum sp.]